jgi:hypothetical protein
MIEEASKNWKKKFPKLWNELVPSKGPAKSLQGELIRTIGKITDEIYRNGNLNWDKDYDLLLDFLNYHLTDPHCFSQKAISEITLNMDKLRNHRHPDVSGDASPSYIISGMVVAWCEAHPDPMTYTPTSSRR